jgi:hypothetical protein
VPAIAFEHAHYDELKVRPLSPFWSSNLHAACLLTGTREDTHGPPALAPLVARECLRQTANAHSVPSARATVGVTDTVGVPLPGLPRASTLVPPRSAGSGAQPSMALASWTAPCP